jgi:hypothetical protein
MCAPRRAQRGTDTAAAQEERRGEEKRREGGSLRMHRGQHRKGVRKSGDREKENG